MNRMLHIALCLSLSAFLSCSKSGTPGGGSTGGGGSTTTGSTTPAQYGTPFSGVPNASDAAIYQVNMRAFSSTGDFAGVTARLDSIKALGINVVYLLPIYPVGVLKSINSPYCIQYFDSVSTEYGTLTDLRALVDGAHQRNMAVILDWVAEETSWDNPWISNTSWYQTDGAGNIISPNGYNDVAALNFNSSPMRAAMIQAMKYWVYAANIDGYRMDDADVVPFNFWQQAVDTLRAISTHKLLLLAEGSAPSEFTAGFNLQYDFGAYGIMKNIFANGQHVTSLDSLTIAEYGSMPAGDYMMRYTSNHDVDLSDGTPLTLFGGQQGSIAAFLAQAYMQGIPMVYNGQEVGCPTQLTYFNTSTTINWSINPGMEVMYKQILGFRASSTALRQGAWTTYSSSDVVAFTKMLGTDTVVVIDNLRSIPISYTVPTALQGSWTNAFDGSTSTLGASVTLPAYGYIVLHN